MSSLFDLVKPNTRVAIIANENGPVKPFVIDATVQESHNLSTQITEFPVEDGSNISDHIIKKPFKLTLNCVISDDPINLTDLVQSTAVGLASSVFGSKAIIAAGVASKISGELLAKGRAKNSKTSKEILEGYQKNGDLLTISTSLEVYTNMLIENISIPRTAQNSSSLTFSMTLKQINVVSKELVTVDLEKVAPEAQGAVNPVDQGRQAVTEAADALKKKGASLLLKIGRSF